MNYLKICTDKLRIAIKGYKTPQKVLAKIDNTDLIQNPQWQNKTKE